MRARLVLVVAAVVVAVAAAQPAPAQGDWRFTVAPYLFACAMDGTVAVKGHDVDVDVPFSDIADALDLGALIHFDMRNDRFLIQSGLAYMDLSQSADVAGGTAEVGVTQTVFDVIGGYRVSEAFAVVIGARLIDLSAELDFSGPHADWSGDGGKSWVDPIVGAHVDVPLSRSWWWDLHADVGGFGVGSQLSFMAYTDVGYAFSDWVSAYAGFRVLDVDYESGSGSDRFVYDVMTSGPQLGVAFRF